MMEDRQRGSQTVFYPDIGTFRPTPLWFFIRGAGTTGLDYVSEGLLVTMTSSFRHECPSLTLQSLRLGTVSKVLIVGR